MTVQEAGTRRPDSVTIIAIYHFVEAALFLVGLLALGIAALAVSMGASGDPEAAIPLAALAVAGVVVLVLLVVNVAVGWGLLALKSWARWVAVALSVLRLFFFPIGTVIGALIIVFLLQKEARDAFATP